MATKKTRKLFVIESLLARAQTDVATYREIVDQLGILLERHPEVKQEFLITTVLNKFEVTEEWFSDMREHHKQSIIDSVRGRK